MAVAVITASCKKDNMPIDSNSNNPVVGNWKIFSFVDNGVNQTSQFAAYTFTFSSNNHLQITARKMLDMCNWTLTDSIYHFNMMGMHSNALNELDDYWKLMNFSDTTCTFATVDNTAHNRSLILRRN